MGNYRRSLRLILGVSSLGALMLGGCSPAGELSPESFASWEQPRELLTAQVELPGRGLQTVTYEMIDGQAVLEGDILLNLPDGQTRSGMSVGRQAASTRWPNGIIPYVIDANLPNTARVTSAIAHWESKTSLRFKPRTTESDYVKFVPGSGCSSNVGRIGGVQGVNLADGCSVGSTIHEIGHAVGLWHEQSRADRDNHVLINWSNIQPGLEHNFMTYTQQGSDGLDLGSYDYGSIMHYDGYAFSSNGQPTIVRKDGGGTANLGQRHGLSDGDTRGAEALYGMRARFSSAVASNRCLDVAGGNTAQGTSTQTWECNGTAAQDWFLTARGEVRSALAPNLCLDVSNASPAPGTQVQIWECNGTAAQKWTLSGGQVRSAVGSNLCLDVANAGTAMGTQVQIWECNGTAAQLWTQF